MWDGTGGTQIAGLLGGTYSIGTANATWVQGTDSILRRTATTVGNDGNTLQPQDPIKLSQSLPDPVQAMPKTFIFYTPLAMAIMSRRTDAVTANDQTGQFVFNLNRDPETGLPNGLYGNRVITSYNAPANGIKGTGTNLTTLLLGAFSDWFIARSGVVEFDTNPYTYFASVQTLLRTIQYLDAGPRHNASFAFISELLPTT
jgi:HK97 family phage major capsid protein